jgi:hypothetical protein
MIRLDRRKTSMSSDALPLFIAKWQHLYNTDIVTFLDELYAPGGDFSIPGLVEFEDHAAFHALGQAVLAAAPDRKIHIVEVITCGDTYVIQGVWQAHGLERPELKQPFCAILTVEDRKVVRDHTYIDSSLVKALDASFEPPGSVSSKS